MLGVMRSAGHLVADPLLLVVHMVTSRFPATEHAAEAEHAARTEHPMGTERTAGPEERTSGRRRRR